MVCGGLSYSHTAIDTNLHATSCQRDKSSILTSAETNNALSRRAEADGQHMLQHFVTARMKAAASPPPFLVIVTGCNSCYLVRWGGFPESPPKSPTC